MPSMTRSGRLSWHRRKIQPKARPIPEELVGKVAASFRPTKARTISLGSVTAGVGTVFFCFTPREATSAPV